MALDSLQQLFLPVLLFAAGFLALLFMIAGLITRIYEGAVFNKLKNTIRRNPDLGKEEEDGNFVFKHGRFTFKYKLIDSTDASGKKTIKPIFIKRRLMPYEERLKNFQKSVKAFWLYRKWINFLQPRVFFPLLSVILILYLAFLEPEGIKLNRIRWIISKILGINKESVAVKPAGVTISLKRETAADKQIEPVNFNFNPVAWLTFQDDGYIIRDRGEEFGSVNYPVIYEDSGKIQLKKEEEWVKGKPDSEGITWEKAQGSGVRQGKVLGNTVLRSEDNKILIKDK